MTELMILGVLAAVGISMRVALGAIPGIVGFMLAWIAMFGLALSGAQLFGEVGAAVVLALFLPCLFVWAWLIGNRDPT